MEILLALLLSAAPARAAFDVETRVQTLLDQMTPEEKLGQLQQLDGEDEGTRPTLPGLARKGGLGSVLAVTGAKNVNALQRVAVEESRLKIPILFGQDVIHGFRTIFPIPLALASSWDPDAVERVARVSADEAEAAGVRWTFSPMVDIARDPRWGRISEGAGEDPYLGGVMARAWVRGYQGDDPGAVGHLAACVKHWVAYGAAEGGRDYNTADVSERSLREVYFPPFRAAVDAGVMTVMSSFNDLNGVPASGDRWTLTDVLRGEWKFPGMVVSDYNAVTEMINHGAAADPAQAAALALTAGVDMEMQSTAYRDALPRLVAAKLVPEPAVEEAVRRVLRVKFRLGLFERPYADEVRESSSVFTGANRAAARSVAARSMVLLKNDGGLLPLGKNIKKLAVIGPLGDDAKGAVGNWALNGRLDDTVTLLSGLRAKLPSVEVSFTSGTALPPAMAFSSAAGSGTDFSAAVRAAKYADVVILALGEGGDMTGEASSRSSLDLPGRQLELARAVLAAGKPTVVVLFNGRPLAIPELAAAAPAILEVWQPGTEGGGAIADVLFGDASPGGKLPATFPRSVGQVPIYYDHLNTGRPASSERYSSRYLDDPAVPLYAFGWGLSYARTRLSDLAVFPARIAPDRPANVTVFATNEGSRAGDEVVELYIRRRFASVSRPVAELKGFSRVTLAPGERRRVDFTLSPKDLGFYGLDMKYSVEPGDYEITVGTCSVGGLTTRLTVSK